MVPAARSYRRRRRVPYPSTIRLGVRMRSPAGSRKRRLIGYRAGMPYTGSGGRLRGGGGGARTGGFLGIETKFIDYTYAGAIPATLTGGEADPPGAGAQTTPGSISAIAQGDGESNRDGRKCTLTSLHIKGNVGINADATGISLPNIIRVIVVWDTQTNGAQLNAEDVFLAASHKEFSFRNLQFSKRFRVLKDATFVINPTAAAGDGTSLDSAAHFRTFKWNFKLDIPVIHSGTTAVIASITDNSLHVLAWAATTGLSTLNYESRVRFVG